MLYVRFPLSLRNLEDLRHERGIEICHETVRFWWNRFGPMFAAEIRRRRVDRMRACRQWRWHLDEVYVKINGVAHYLWRAVDHEGEVLESIVTKTRDRKAELVPSVSTKGAGNAAVPAHANLADVCLGACLGAQPLSDGAPPPEPRPIQADPRRRSCRVARPSRGLMSGRGGANGDWFAFV